MNPPIRGRSVKLTLETLEARCVLSGLGFLEPLFDTPLADTLSQQAWGTSSDNQTEE